MSDTRSQRGSLDREIAVVAEVWADSSYYEDAERWTFLFWDLETPFRHLFEKLDLTSVVELACGHGRHSERIVNSARHITMIDILDSNLEYCRQRLGINTNISFIKGDGSTFRPLADNSVTAIFCYDAMVHFSPEMVRSYLTDTARILTPGGMALFHHSNYAAPLDQHYGLNPHARNHMTAALFSTYAQMAGLVVTETKIMRWGEISDLDALTLLRKSALP
jgi:ubiquinone/menaquinone biosynthesis C-methylase UbiE